MPLTADLPVQPKASLARLRQAEKESLRQSGGLVEMQVEIAVGYCTNNVKTVWFEALVDDDPVTVIVYCPAAVP